MVHDLQILALGLFSHLLSLDKIVTNIEDQVLDSYMLTLTLNISIHGILQWTLMYR